MYNPVRYVDPSGNVPLLDFELFPEEFQSVEYSENQNNAENSEPNSSNSDLDNLYFDGEVTVEELISWREWLSTRKKMLYGGDFCVKASVQGILLLLALLPPVGTVVALGGEMILPQLADTLLDYQQDEYDTLLEYIDDAINFAESNTGVVNITIGNPKGADEWGSSISIQYGEEDPLVLFTPVPVIEIFIRSSYWEEE
jgi:hypothetical protein